MKRQFVLSHISTPGRQLDFTWDSETGTITGPDAGYVLAICHEAIAAGGYWPPGVPGFEIKDPLNNLGELAAVLDGYQLPDDMLTDLEHVPRFPDEEIKIADLDGKPIDILITD